MNIEQIAKEAWIEVCKSSSVGQSIAEPFLRHCLSKLAEQDVVPYAWDSESMGLTFENHYSDAKPLYTEAQYLAAQQRTAEACAKLCDDGSVKLLHFLEQKGAEKCADAIRFGEWREYL